MKNDDLMFLAALGRLTPAQELAAYRQFVRTKYWNDEKDSKVRATLRRFMEANAAFLEERWATMPDRSLKDLSASTLAEKRAQTRWLKSKRKPNVR